MISITDYSTAYIKVNNNNSEIYFLAKSGLSVSGSNGNIIFLTSGNDSRTFKGVDITEPKLTTLDEQVVRFREFIDNV